MIFFKIGSKIVEDILDFVKIFYSYSIRMDLCKTTVYTLRSSTLLFATIFSKFLFFFSIEYVQYLYFLKRTK